MSVVVSVEFGLNCYLFLSQFLLLLTEDYFSSLLSSFPSLCVCVSLPPKTNNQAHKQTDRNKQTLTTADAAGILQGFL
jgi:hypothetical protein